MSSRIALCTMKFVGNGFNSGAVRVLRFDAADILDDYRLDGALRLIAEEAATPLPPRSG
jgi:hypothetical protein